MGRKKKIKTELDFDSNIALVEESSNYDEDNIINFEYNEDEEIQDISLNLDNYISDLENKNEEEYDKEISDEEIYKKIEKNEKEYIADWGIPLLDKTKTGIIIEQMGYKYFYIPIMDPNNDETGYFSCHCNPKNELIHYPDPTNSNNILNKPKFKTNNICLSKRYVIADVEEYIECLKREINISNENSYSSPFYLFWTGKTKVNLPSLFEDSMMQKIFEMFSCINTKEFDKFKNNIEVSVCNRYDGKSSIRLNYTLNLKAVDEKGESYNFKEYFILNRHGFKIPHTYGKFDKILSNLNSLKEYINTDYEIMSSYIPTDEEIYKISSKLKKGEAKKYRQQWESIPAGQKNLLISLLMASCSLNKNFIVSSYVELQSIIDAIMYKAIKEWERNNK